MQNSPLEPCNVPSEKRHVSRRNEKVVLDDVSGPFKTCGSEMLVTRELITILPGIRLEYP